MRRDRERQPYCRRRWTEIRCLEKFAFLVGIGRAVVVIERGPGLGLAGEGVDINLRRPGLAQRGDHVLRENDAPRRTNRGMSLHTPGLQA